MRHKVEEPEAIGSTTKVTDKGSVKFAKLAMKSTVQRGKTYLERLREMASKTESPEAEY
jgi:hypothetical protein